MLVDVSRPDEVTISRMDQRTGLEPWRVVS